MKPKRVTRPGRWPAAKKPHRFAHTALTIERVPIEDLRPNQNNSRLHPREQIDKITRAIAEFGFLIPALIDDGNMIIAGHARIEAAKKLGLAEVPCIRTSHLSEAQKRKFTILDNRLAEDSVWDFQLLAKELEFLQAEGIDLQTTGFEIPELETIFANGDIAIAAKNTGDDEVPDLGSARAITKPNDLWIMDDHRLLCGDARRPESFATVLHGSRAQLVFVDPPFNMKIRGPVSGKGRIKHGEFAEASGEKTSAQYAKFLEDSLGLLAEHSEDGSIHYVCIDWRHLYVLLTAGSRVYRELKNLVVWNKTNAGLGSFYRSQHELICVWKNGRGKHTNNIQLGKARTKPQQRLDLCRGEQLQLGSLERPRYAPNGQAGRASGRCGSRVMRHSERKPRARILLKLHYHFGAIGDLWPTTRCDLPNLSLGSIPLNESV
jgi:hypothetical protein